MKETTAMRSAAARFPIRSSFRSTLGGVRRWNCSNLSVDTMPEGVTV